MSVKLVGGDKLAEKLNQLEWKVSKAVSSSVLAEEMEQVKVMMEAAAPVVSGNYKGNFHINKMSSEKKKTTKVRLKNKANHAHLVELGHRIVVNRGEDKGKDTGKRAAANPVMRKVYKANKDKIVHSLIDNIRSALRSV